jgi:fucose 4-O-acetylase-like acetyltransferase
MSTIASLPARRSAHLDNCKGVLIAAVVWYHSLVVYYSVDLPFGFVGLESVLLLLVMPGFSLLSGYLSNPNLNYKRQDNLFSMGAAFVVFQVLNWIMGVLNSSSSFVHFQLQQFNQ